MSRSPTITDGIWSSNPADWLANPHAGEMLASEFLEPLGLSADELAERIGVDSHRIDALVGGTARVDGELDLRLTRYFGMAEGFFLGLQDQFELLEAKRSIHDALDRIVPRAA